MSIFNPTTNLNVHPLYHISPIKFCSNDPNGRYYMGADQMAMSLIFFTLLYHRMWYVALPFMAIDLAYYGPATLGGLVAPIIGALVLL